MYTTVSNLTLSKVSFASRGRYTCQSDNNYPPSASSAAALTVHGKLHLKMSKNGNNITMLVNHRKEIIRLHVRGTMVTQVAHVSKATTSSAKLCAFSILKGEIVNNDTHTHTHLANNVCPENNIPLQKYTSFFMIGVFLLIVPCLQFCHTSPMVSATLLSQLISPKLSFPAYRLAFHNQRSPGRPPCSQQYRSAWQLQRTTPLQPIAFPWQTAHWPLHGHTRRTMAHLCVLRATLLAWKPLQRRFLYPVRIIFIFATLVTLPTPRQKKHAPEPEHQPRIGELVLFVCQYIFYKDGQIANRS